MASNPRFNTQKAGTVRRITPPSISSFSRGSGENTVEEFKSGNIGAADRTTLTETQKATTITPVMAARSAPVTKIITPETSPLSPIRESSGGLSFDTPQNNFNRVMEERKTGVRQNVLSANTGEILTPVPKDKGFFGKVIGGFRNPENIENVGSGTPSAEQLGGGLRFGTEGAIGGLSFAAGFGLLDKGAKVVKVADVAFKGTKIGSFLTGTKTGVFITKATTGYAGVTTLVKIPEAYRNIFPNENLKNIKSQGADIGLIKQAGIAAQKERLGKEGLLNIPFTEKQFSYKRFLSDYVPFVGSTFSSPASQREFQVAAFEEARNQGLSQSDSIIAAQEAQINRDIQQGGKLGASIFIGATAEITGRTNQAITASRAAGAGVTVSKNKIGGYLFGKSFKDVFPAGFIEGSGEYVSDILVQNKTFSLPSFTLAGTLGGLTAGTVSGLISRTKVTAPTTSKLINIGANIADPLEKPSDITADLVTAGLKTSGYNVAVPTLNFPTSFNDPKNSFSFTAPSFTTTGKTRTEKGRGTPANVNPSVNLKAVVTEITGRPSGGKGGGTSSTFSYTPTNEYVPVNPITDTNSNVPTITPVPTTNIVNTNTNTNIITSALTLTTTSTIPTVSFVPKIPPPLPLSLGFGGGGRGAKKGKGTGFFNELAAGQALLEKSTGGLRLDPITVFKKPKPKRVKKTKKQKKKDKDRKAFSDRFDIPSVPIYKSKDPLRLVFG